jgi:hypothetical protein
MVSIFTRDKELFTEPAKALIEAILAEVLMSTNLGSATAERIPKMTMTTISSIKVKPFTNTFISLCELRVNWLTDFITPFIAVI